MDMSARAADRAGDPLIVPWPMPGNLVGFVSFETFAEWNAFIERWSLRQGSPLIVTSKFARAQKLHLLAWPDFNS